MARQPHAEDRIRHKRGRWITPRVSAAVLSTIYNRWTTARRFQQRTQACNQCVLGCPIGAEDSIEHYCRCHVVRSFGLMFLNFSFSHDDALEEFVLAGVGTRWTENKDDLAKLAILVYAVYRTTNTARTQGRVSPTFAKQMLGQFAKEAVRGHPRSSKVWDGAWTNRTTSTASQVDLFRPSPAAIRTIGGTTREHRRSRSPRR